MKKLTVLIIMVAIAGIAVADILFDSDFSGAGFAAVNTEAINLELFCDTVGWTTYSTADWSYDAANNKVDRIGTVSFARAIGQAFRTADIRPWSSTDTLSVVWTAESVSQDNLTLQVFGTSDTTFGGRPRLQDMALPANAVELGSFTMTEITASGGTMTATISDWSSYTYLVVRVGSENWNGANVSIQSVGAVPEPATAGMLGLGSLIALVFRRIRR